MSTVKEYILVIAAYTSIFTSLVLKGAISYSNTLEMCFLAAFNQVVGSFSFKPSKSKTLLLSQDYK